MRAAQINEDGVVINFAEVSGFDDAHFIDPRDAVIGSIWNGTSFNRPVQLLPTVADYTDAIQSMLDTKAQERNYYNILSACTYATSMNATFKAEAQACLSWRDAVWAKSYDVLAQVKAGTLAQPTIAQMLSMLPAMTWPT